jgi:hypothetical protein
MRRFTRVALAIATVMGSAVIGSGIAGAATPDTPTCTFGSSSGNVQTCINIISGPRVTATATIPINGSARNLLVCVQEPSGILAPDGCSGDPENTYEKVNPGGGIDGVYPQTGSAPAGRYCADTWRMNASGSPTMIGQACKHT